VRAEAHAAPDRAELRAADRRQRLDGHAAQVPMIFPDASPLDADVEWVGDGPVPPEPVGNDDPAPGIP
jgi:hypothetical protein